MDSTDFTNKYDFISKLYQFEDYMKSEFVDMLKQQLDKPLTVTTTIVQEVIKVKVPCKANFDEFIGFQNAQGFWPFSEECKAMLEFFMADVKFFNFDGIEKIKALLNDAHLNEEDSDKILATLVALYLLQETFADRESEWRLIAKKAKDWLKKVGIEKPEA